MLEVKRGGSATSGRSGDRDGAAQPLADVGDRRRGALVGGVDPALVVGEGAGHDRQLVAQVVEDEQHVGDHQRHVGQPERVGVRLAERLDRAHQVVAEEADRAAGERRQALDRRRLGSGQVLGDRARRGRAPSRSRRRPLSESTPSLQRSTERGRMPTNE